MTSDDLLTIEAIRTLRYHYSELTDAGRLSEIADLFTQDATCDLGSAYGGPWLGREQIRAGYLEFSAYATVPNEIMHIVTNPQILLDGNGHAHGRWYLQNMLAKTGVPQPLLALGIYEDRYHRIDGRWLFASLRLRTLWPQRSD